MAIIAPPAPLQMGQRVRRSIDPVKTQCIGIVAGFVWVHDPPLVLVRWPGGPSTFESEGTLVEVYQPQP